MFSTGFGGIVGKKFVVAIAVVVVAFIGVKSVAAAPKPVPKAGGVCTSVNQSVKSVGKMLVCTKAGKRLVWVAKPVAATPTPNPTVSKDPYVSPTSTAGSIDDCKLPDQSAERRQFGNIYGAFPALGSDLPHQGTIKVALIPVDWADLPGQPSPLTRVNEQMKTFTDWYDTVSEGRVKFEWVTYDGWVRLPGSSSDFVIPQSTWSQPFLRTAIAASDPVFDFSGVQAVNFLLPSGQQNIGQSTQGFPWVLGGGVQSNEGLIRNYTVPGAYFDRAPTRNYWSYWAHEVGHMFQLAHLTPYSGTGQFFGYDLMGSQDGPTRTLSTWMRFIAGWMNDSQIYCKQLSDLQPTQMMLNPINNRTNGIKSAMIKTSPTKLVVVESRRWDDRFDCLKFSDRNGVLVYTVDSTLGHMDDMLHLALVPGREKQNGGNCGTAPGYDALLKPGESVSVDGVKVDYTTMGKYDTVNISAG